MGLWLTPYLIRHLGVAAYGLVPLAVTVTSYMGLFTTALNAAVGRFITLCLDRHDYAEANRIFNTSFWGTVAVLVILLGPASMAVLSSSISSLTCQQVMRTSLPGCSSAPLGCSF